MNCNEFGRHVRHSQLNDIIKRALTSAGVPALLEPTGLSRDDGKRPDGVTLTAWQSGRMLLWDATCSDTLAPSYIRRSTFNVRAAASLAEERKRAKYSTLSCHYHFIPLAVETLGAWGLETIAFVGRVGLMIASTTFEPRATAFLRQRLSLAIQRGNAACMWNAFPTEDPMAEIYLL
jgi:hypothetical protein